MVTDVALAPVTVSVLPAPSAVAMTVRAPPVFALATDVLPAPVVTVCVPDPLTVAATVPLSPVAVRLPPSPVTVALVALEPVSVSVLPVANRLASSVFAPVPAAIDRDVVFVVTVRLSARPLAAIFSARLVTITAPEPFPVSVSVWPAAVALALTVRTPVALSTIDVLPAPVFTVVEPAAPVSVSAPDPALTVRAPVALSAIAVAAVPVVTIPDPVAVTFSALAAVSPIALIVPLEKLLTVSGVEPVSVSVPVPRARWRPPSRCR